MPSTSSATRIPHLEANTIARALRHASSTWPDSEALVIGDTRLSFRELERQSRLAASNLHRLGLRPGEHLAICMGNSPQWVVTAYAAWCLGAVVVPVNTRFKAEELRYCLEQSDAVFLVMADRFLKVDFIDMLRQVEPALSEALPGRRLPMLRRVLVAGSDVPQAALSFEELARADAPALPPEMEPQPDEVALIQYTSGTTAFPKGAQLTNSGLVLDAWHFGKRLGLVAGERYYSGRPLFHVSGTTLSVLACLMAGACYLTTPSFTAGAALRIMEQERCTITSGNDTMFLMMMNDPDFRRERLCLRAAMVAASEEIARQVVDTMGIPGVCAGYGLSEASPNAALSPVDDDLDKRVAGFALPLPGVEAKIFDPEGGAVLPAGTLGEIRIRGWNVMRGYYKMPEATARTIDAEGWLHTGDLGVADEAGRIRFIDRLKDMFRVGGENVAPADVENVLNAHPAVAQAQVVGVPDPRLTQVAAAYVILKHEGAATADDLVAWCKQRSAGFKVPRYVRFVDSFDAIGMTGSAKIQRNKLRDFAMADLGLPQPRQAHA